MDLAIDAKCGGSKPIGDGPFFKSFGFSCFLLVRDLGHFLIYRSLLAVGWKIAQILRLCRRKTTNTGPTTLSSIQTASQSTYQCTIVLNL
jgi:hypothetical protein